MPGGQSWCALLFCWARAMGSLTGFAVLVGHRYVRRPGLGDPLALEGRLLVAVVDRVSVAEEGAHRVSDIE